MNIRIYQVNMSRDVNTLALQVMRTLRNGKALPLSTAPSMTRFLRARLSANRLKMCM